MTSPVLTLLFLIVGILYLTGKITSAVATTLVPTPPLSPNAWVHPEDLPPLPQCIAQQDTSVWLSPLTKCTSKQCTRHFGIICTHHQWLTHTSCLGTSFGPDVLTPYLEQCSRSVLAKAQLLGWIHRITGRTWFIDMGDAWDVNPGHVPETSLVDGFKDVGVVGLAPRCLIGSKSASDKESMESFGHVMDSCSFTAMTQQMGNADRPWEYNQGAGSMVALDFETVGYNDLTDGEIREGQYFDRECFCKSFGIEEGEDEACQGPGLDLTKERLWLRATCAGSTIKTPYGGENWTHGLRITPSFEYVSAENWRWPGCVSSLPKQVIGTTEQCETDACELDSEGYCSSVKRVVSRSCFCHDISYYDTCKGPCRNFENRVEYVNWLHNLCGAVEGWHGLPENWRNELTMPKQREMIPWDWNVQPRHESCNSANWIMGGLALIGGVTILAGLFTPKQDTQIRASITYVHNHLQSYPRPWIPVGLAISSLLISANWINTMLVQTTPGYEDVPILQLLLLWCTIPRFTWATLVTQLIRQETTLYTLQTTASILLAEIILQLLASVHIFGTLSYGIKYSFYTDGMARLISSSSARFMYAGALIWVVVVVASICLLALSALRTRDSNDMYGEAETSSLLRNSKVKYGGRKSYGTIYASERMGGAHSLILLIATTIMMLLCMAQWGFWYGFVGLAGEEFCPPNFSRLVLVWGFISLCVAMVARGLGGNS